VANPEHIEALRAGIDVWNRFRREVLRPIEPEYSVLKNADGHTTITWTENPYEVDFDGADLRGLDLSGANLAKASCHEVDLSGADLSGANLNQALLWDANLSGANLSGANLEKAGLRNANLTDAEVARANFTAVDLIGSNLSGLVLDSIDFTEVLFIGANLKGATIRKANLTRADFTEADLSETSLHGAVLNHTNLTRTKLRRASFGETVLADLDLSTVQGLEQCRHAGPSMLDHRTLKRSRVIPVSFLRGCGIPEQLITYLPSLFNNPVQFYSCFISYSTKDQDFADRLYSDLQAKGVRCWFAPHDLQGGKKLHEQIDEAIRVYERLLLILSDSSMSSEWVKSEIAKARRRESVEGRRMLFPVRLVEFEKLREWECFDADTGKDTARELREYYVPDFSRRKQYDAYSEEFEKLIRDLMNTLSAR
jgi:uncharacterized protein YjbI with pentapeptide repeats